MGGAAGDAGSGETAAGSGGGEASGGEASGAGGSGGESGSNLGGAGGALADETVQLIHAIPTDGATHVGVLDKIELEYSGPLLKSSVNGASVRLLAPYATNPMAAKVSYDAVAQTITLIPGTALQVDSLYRIRTIGLKDSAGADVADAALSFRTVYNSVIDTLFANGSAAKYTLDDEGRQVGYRALQPGADKTFFTDDDVVTGRYVQTFVGPLRTRTNYKPGADLTFFTEDDFVSGVSDYARDGISLARGGAHTSGPDGIFLTADDSWGQFNESQYDADGLETTFTVWANAGADGAPYTADDPVAYWMRDERTGTNLARYYLGSPGKDQQWLTDDDQLIGHYDYNYDASFLLAVYRAYDAGKDGIVATDDDAVNYARRNDYDPSGLLRYSFISFDGGQDGVWGTEDDLLKNFTQYDHDEAGNVTVETTYNCGPDHLADSADDSVDVIQHYDTAH